MNVDFSNKRIYLSVTWATVITGIQVLAGISGAISTHKTFRELVEINDRLTELTKIQIAILDEINKLPGKIGHIVRDGFIQDIAAKLSGYSSQFRGLIVTADENGDLQRDTIDDLRTLRMNVESTSYQALSGYGVPGHMAAYTGLCLMRCIYNAVETEKEREKEFYRIYFSEANSWLDGTGEGFLTEAIDNAAKEMKNQKAAFDNYMKRHFLGHVSSMDCTGERYYIGRGTVTSGATWTSQVDNVKCNVGKGPRIYSSFKDSDISFESFSQNFEDITEEDHEVLINTIPDMTEASLIGMLSYYRDDKWLADRESEFRSAASLCRSRYLTASEQSVKLATIKKSIIAMRDKSKEWYDAV